MKRILLLFLLVCNFAFAEGMGIINYTPPDVTAIKAKTDNLPANTSTELTTIQNLHAVPTADVVTNTNLRDVAGKFKRKS